MRKAGRIDEGWAAFVQCCFILLSVRLVPLYLHVYQESVWGFLQSFRSTCVTSEATRSINVPAEIHFLYIFINLRLFFLIVFQSLDGDRQRWNDNVLFYGPRGSEEKRISAYTLQKQPRPQFRRGLACDLQEQTEEGGSLSEQERVNSGPEVDVNSCLPQR